MIQLPGIRRKRFYIGFAIFMLAYAVYFPFSPGVRQQRNMSKAQTFADQHLAEIRTDPRFAEVQMEPHTFSNGSLFVTGSVATRADCEALRAVIQSLNPPVNYSIHVDVKSEP